MIKDLVTYYMLILCVCIPYKIEGRSLKRPADEATPCITVQPSDPTIAHTWYSATTHNQSSNKDAYTLQSPYLRINPIVQGFDHRFFKQHYLPQNQLLEFRNKQGSVLSSTLEKLAETLEYH